MCLLGCLALLYILTREKPHTPTELLRLKRRVHTMRKSTGQEGRLAARHGSIFRDRSRHVCGSCFVGSKGYRGMSWDPVARTMGYQFRVIPRELSCAIPWLLPRHPVGCLEMLQEFAIQTACGKRRDMRGAFTGFVPQIVPDKVPNSPYRVFMVCSFHSVEVFLSCFFVFLCFFFRQIARGRRPTLTLTLTLPQARAPTRAPLRHAFWKN